MKIEIKGFNRKIKLKAKREARREKQIEELQARIAEREQLLEEIKEGSA